jgi:hypothetical protein
MSNPTITERVESLDEDYGVLTTIDAASDAVFDALTTTDGLAAWWTSVSGVGSSGGELVFTFGPGGYVVMRVDAAERGVGVRWTTLACHFTELRFRHEGLTPRLECYGDCKSGWDHFIPSLRAYAETGVGNPNQSPADLARREAWAQHRQSSTAG